MRGVEAASISVLATDYDRTLTDDSLTPVPEALDALARARKLGLRVVIVSGRDWPFLEREVGHVADVLVAENGCLVGRPGEQPRATAARATSLRPLLNSLAIEFEHGEVLASFAAEHEPLVRARLDGASVQLIRNRDRTMLLPEGVDKASGLMAALHLLGATADVAAAAGDGENDVPMLVLVRHGIAVANAVPELKAHAASLTRSPGGLGVAEWLEEAWIPAQGAMR